MDNLLNLQESARGATAAHQAPHKGTWEVAAENTVGLARKEMLRQIALSINESQESSFRPGSATGGPARTIEPDWLWHRTKERRKKMAKEVGSGGVAKEGEERSTDKDDCKTCWE